MLNKIQNIFLVNTDEKDSKLKKIFNIILVAVFVISVVMYSFSKFDYSLGWSSIFDYRIKLINSYIMTIIISFFSLILSVLIGVFFAFARKSRILFLQYISKLYVEIIRGTPFLVQIYVFYFVVATAFGVDNKYVLGVIILSVFSGAYLTEIIRAGIESIDSTQLVTAKSLGFTVYQRYKFVIIPQVIKRIMPAIAGQLSSLIKDSSLLSIIAVSEITQNILEISSINFNFIANVIYLAIGYLLLTIPISFLSRRLERKFHYEA